ncbi:hypothetical protein PHJA_002904800 [Phtheirospermum japonicum]|uniref:Uncharacterized protein n=1 Tax=Phtheirospermum japonicum TaxID=374723 RepID=A0A830D7B5_9LAMI|nr:hypothetical protein PHJA_002904800 [Phtheirospermum japonicum]
MYQSGLVVHLLIELRENWGKEGLDKCLLVVKSTLHFPNERTGPGVVEETQSDVIRNLETIETFDKICRKMRIDEIAVKKTSKEKTRKLD